MMRSSYEFAGFQFQREERGHRKKKKLSVSGFNVVR